MATPVTIDKGACLCIYVKDPDHELIHEYLGDCLKAIEELKVQRSTFRFDDVPRSQSALQWIQTKASEVDCTRFLLRAKTILWDGSAGFYPEESLYWETCASLFGELLTRSGRTGVEIPSGEILDTFASRFLDARGDPWSSRAYLIQFLADFAVRCLPLVTTPESSHFGTFWKTVDIYLCHLQASFDCIGEWTLPMKLRLAMSYLVDLWLRVILTHKAERKDIQEELQGKLTVMAAPLFQMLWRAESGLSDDLGRWQEAMTALLEHIKYKKRSIDTTKRFGELAKGLSAAKDKLDDPAQKRLASFFSTLIPQLQGRDYAGERKVMSEGDDECDVELNGPQNAPVAGKANIKDVCPSSCLGFRIETNAIAVDRNFERGDDIIGALDAGEYSYSYRRIDARPRDGDGPVPVESATLKVKYHFIGEAYEDVFPCRIMRAWRLGDETTGLALRARRADVGGNIPEPWGTYVRLLSDLPSR